MEHEPPEPDETSPKDSGRLSLPEDRPLVASLVAAFRQAVENAMAQAGGVEEDPKTSVHEYRKALRRARSVLRMLRPALRKRWRRALRNELRGLSRPTSILRDADVLVETCDELDVHGQAAEGLALVQARVAAHGDALTAAGEASARLAVGAERLPRIVELLEGVVRYDTSAEALVAAFERTYERVRAARARALEVRTDEATHDWRKRVKELRYQLEMLAEPDGGPVEGLRQVYATQAKRLGEITDFIAMRRYLETHTEDLPGELLAALDGALVDRIERDRCLAADPIVEVRVRLTILATAHEPEASVDSADVTSGPHEITQT